MPTERNSFWEQNGETHACLFSKDRFPLVEIRIKETGEMLIISPFYKSLGEISLGNNMEELKKNIQDKLLIWIATNIM